MAEAQRVEGGIALSIPAIEEEMAVSSSKDLPWRLRRRLLEPKSPVSAEEIEAKLKEADLRRQQYYESLSSKARPKTKSRRQSAQVEDLTQRLETKLNAAEQKRISIFEKAQSRLAKLDELRQAAKSGVELRFEKERDELGTKVESRVQKAAKNRMLLFKAIAQRGAANRQRTAQRLMQKVVQESKYKECVRAAIHQKRAAAEKKRLGFLEAEKSRARAKLSRVRGVANSVYTQRENERRRMMDRLEDRLQRAKKLRAQYLRQRRGLHSYSLPATKMMQKNGDRLSRMLARCWKRFVRYKKTTFALARAYHTLDINEKSVESMAFEQLALRINSATVIRTVKALVDRLETRLTLLLATVNPQPTMENIDHLLKRIASPIQRGSTTNTRSKGGEKSVDSGEKGAQKPIKLVRFPARVFLCAYMIRLHPDAVFSERGEHEIALAESATNLIREFELLMKTILDRPVHTLLENTASGIPSQKNFRSQLEAFDKAWCSYLRCFVVWKVKDAKLLEEDLMRTTHELKRSAVQKCKQSPEAAHSGLAPDMNATNKVMEKHKLLNENSNTGLDLMTSALSVESKCAEVDGGVDTIAPPSSRISSSSLTGSSDIFSSLISGKRVHGSEKLEKLSFIARPLSDKRFSNSDRKRGSTSTTTTSQGRQSFNAALPSENELIINEIVHDNRSSSADSFNTSNDDVNNLQAKVKETMEKAFWDGVMESMKQAEPDFTWVLKLMKEVRDELCEISPTDWRQEIVQTIDTDILSQVLESGSLDIGYLKNILEFALVTLQKLSAPSNEEEIRTTHHKLLKELGEIAQAGDQPNASYAVLLVKGLRFVLQQIQVLKKEISKARLKMFELLLKGPAGLEYLKKAFTNRYGQPNQASASLPLTKQWLLSLHSDGENEWKDHADSFSPLAFSNSGSSQSQGLPPIALRTGGSISAAAASKLNFPSSAFSGIELSECRGETIDLLVRLGVLKLVSKIGGLTLESLPETFQLNLSRLTAVQSQLQKIILISISVLILQQTLFTENLVTNLIDMENMISKCMQGLSKLLDSGEDAGLPEIIETISQFPDGAEHICDPEKLEARKRVMASMLVKSLQAGDPIFSHVSHSVYLATRAAVLAGNNAMRKHWIESALRRVGSAPLSDKVMEVAEVLVLVAVGSRNVHGAWYEELLKSKK